MNKALATVGLLTVTGVFSLCDLCGAGGGTSVTHGGLVSTANAAAVRSPRPEVRVLPQARTQAGRPAGQSTQALARPATAPRTVTLAIRGMTCGGCVLGTRKTLTRLPGVATADVSYEKGTAVVTYDPAKVTVAQIIAAIRMLHYTATVVPAAAA